MDGGAAVATCIRRSLSLVLPAYNEAAGIRQAVQEADEALRTVVGDYEILVVDDGSSDGTADAVREMTARLPRLRLLRHATNCGYGAALRTGFTNARFDHVAFTDADCQFDLHDLGKLCALADDAHIVAGYRLHRQDVLRRRVYSRGYNWLVRALLGTRIRDCDCALKVFQRDAMDKLLPKTNGFFVNAEMLTRARQRGMRVVEVGVTHRPRIGGTSKVSLADVPRTLATLVPFWWSRVVFPNDQRSSKSDWKPHWALGAIAFVALLIFFSRLNCPLLEPDEARYAEIPRQMLAAGDAILPVLHGQPYSHKPPLLYWLVMASYSTFGISDAAARLVPCTAAFLIVMLTYLWGRRAIGSRAAFMGALMVCLSARFVYLGRMLSMDTVLALWIVASWAAAHVALQRGALACRWWVLSAVACGFGMLTKGPVALVLIVVPILAFQLLDPRVARPRLAAWLAYLAAVGVVALPWYIAVAFRDLAFVTDFVWTHNILRFVAPLDHEEPFWYFMPSLLLGMLPWTLLLPALVKLLIRRFGVKAGQRPAGLGFVLLTGLWCLAFYSVGGCKRPGYIIPVMPPLGLALGFTLHSMLPVDLWAVARSTGGRLQAQLAYRATLLVLAGGMAVSIAAMVSGLITVDLGCMLAGAALTALALMVHRGPLERSAAMWGTCAVVTLAVLLVGLHQLLPGYEQRFSLREHVQPQLDLSQTSDMPVVCYPRRWDSVSFYLGRDDVRVFGPEHRHELIDHLRRRPETILFVKSDTPDKTPLRDLLRALPASLEFVPHSRHGIVTTGVVQRRREAPAMMLVRR